MNVIGWNIDMMMRKQRGRNKEEDGSKLLVSPEHRVYGAVDNMGYASNPSFFKTISFPSKSSGASFSLSNLENDFNKDSCSFWGILNHITENTFSLGNKTESVKSESFVTSTRFSDFESDANLPFEMPSGLIITLNPFELRNLSNLLLTFSSRRNLSFDGDGEDDIISTSGQISSVVQSSLNMLGSQRREILNNLFDGNFTFQHLQYLPDHNSGSFKGGLSMANLRVNNNMFANFNSHNNNNIDAEYINTFSLIKITAIYHELKQNPRLELFSLNQNKNPVKVKSIKKVPFKGKIYAVTVKNHIILVRHGNSTPIWCGNECDETGYVVSKVLTNVAVDDCDWQTDSAGTPSSNTCSNIDHTLGTTERLVNIFIKKLHLGGV